MVRRLGAMAAGLFVSQVAMVVSLVLAIGLLAAAADWPVVVVAGAVGLLLLPGAIGGALAGIIARGGAVPQGGLVGLVFGLSILMVKAFVAPGLGYSVMPFDYVVYPLLALGLTVSGAIGGYLATRWRPAGRADRRAVEALPAGQ